MKLKKIIKTFFISFALVNSVGASEFIKVNINKNLSPLEFSHLYNHLLGAELTLGQEKKLLDDIYPKYFVSHVWGESAKPENWDELKKLNAFKIALDYCERDAYWVIRRLNHRKVVGATVLMLLAQEVDPGDIYTGDPYMKDMSRDSLLMKEIL